MSTFDADRNAPHITQRVGKPFRIRHYGDLPLTIADTGDTVTAPVRAAGNEAQDMVLEIGPFTLDPADAAALASVIDDFTRMVEWAQGGK